MKNFLIYIIVSSALSITGGMIYAKYYLSPRVKEIVQNKASEVLGVPVQIHDLRVLILPRLSLAATGIKFTMTNPNLKVEIPKVFITAPLNSSLFSRTSTFGPIKIKLESPHVVLETKSADPKSPNNGASFLTNAIKINYTRDVSIEMSVEQAKLKIIHLSHTGEVENETNIDPLDIEMVLPGIEKDWRVNLRTNLSMSHPQFSIPIEIQSDFSYKDQNLSLAQAIGNIAGISFVLSGEQKFLEKIGNWKAVVDTPDFSKMRTPPRLPFLKNLGGGIHADLSAVLAPGQAWQFFGGITAKSLIGDIDWSHENLLVRGPFKLDCDTKFSFFKTLKIEHLALHTKLEQLEMTHSGLFSKPRGTQFFVDMNLTGRNQILNILDFTLGLANLRAYANGSIALSKDQPSEINIHIDPLSLTGWEKYLSLFSSAPLMGQVSSDLSIRGDLTKDWYLDFHSLKIDKMKAVVNYTSDDKNFEVSGPIEINTEIKGSYDLKNLSSSTLSFNGLANLNFSSFEYVSDTKSLLSVQPTVAISAAGMATGGIPKWSGFKFSRFKMNAQIKQFHFDNLMADDVVAIASINDQRLAADIKMNKFAGGEAEIKNISVDLKMAKPEFTALADLKSINVNELISGFYPESVGLVKGDASGQVAFSFLIDQGDLAKIIKANGKVDLKNALIANRGLDDVINEKLSQLPGVGKVKASPNSAGSEMTLLFGLADMKLNVLDFKLLTPFKSELLAKGSVILDTKIVNLSGTAFLADAPIGGDIRVANSDSQGRFVIPYTVQGNLRNPQASFAQKSVEEILKKTMLFVAKRETADQVTPSPTAPPVLKAEETPKPTQNKVEALKNRLQGLFNKH